MEPENDDDHVENSGAESGDLRTVRDTESSFIEFVDDVADDSDEDVVYNSGGESAAKPDIRSTVAKDVSLVRAYFLCITLGFVGAHYYYLGRRTEGMLYTVTLGFGGIGWIVDLFRLPSIARDVARLRREEAENGYALYAVPYGALEDRSIITAYLYCIPPWGFLGIHHMYLGTFREHEFFNAVYTATLGHFGFGWFFDLFRIPTLVRRANEDLRQLRSGKMVSANASDTMHLDTAYSIAFPLGFLGLHHFYLKRRLYGLIYLLTGGLAGIGVLVDLVRLPIVFARSKTEAKNQGFPRFHVDDAYLMWFPFGIFGLHRFYLHRWKMGLLYLFTFGFIGVGWLIDGFRMRTLVNDCNARAERNLLWEQTLTKRTKNQNKKTNTNMFIDSQLYNYPVSDEDGNIHVYAFPLRPDGRPSWSLGWAWYLTSTDPGDYLSTQNGEPHSPRSRLVDESPNGAAVWIPDITNEEYDV